MRLTKKERLCVAREMAKRCKDVIFANAYEHSLSVVNNIQDNEISTENQENIIEICYKVKMCIGDILQIVGRERRKRK